MYKRYDLKIKLVVSIYRSKSSVYQQGELFATQLIKQKGKHSHLGSKKRKIQSITETEEL